MARFATSSNLTLEERLTHLTSQFYDHVEEMLSPEFRRRSFSTMEWLGRYSMTDVMVLALMIFYVNASGYTEASVLPGVYFFAASTLMTMFAYGWANSINPGTAPRHATLQA